MVLKFYTSLVIYFCAFSSTWADDATTTAAPAAPAKIIPIFTYDETEINEARVAVMKRQNVFRCMHNAPPLKLSDEINKIAQKHSDTMAKELKTIGMSNVTDLGENVGMVSAFIKPTTKEKPSLTEKALEVIDDLYYSYSKPATDISASANSSFSQLVWKDTAEVGIGITAEYGDPQADGNKFLLFYVTLNYKPAGNILGEEEKNIEPLASKTEGDCEKEVEGDE